LYSSFWGWGSPQRGGGSKIPTHPKKMKCPQIRKTSSTPTKKGRSNAPSPTYFTYSWALPSPSTHASYLTPNNTTVFTRTIYNQMIVYRFRTKIYTNKTTVFKIVWYWTKTPLGMTVNISNQPIIHVRPHRELRVATQYWELCVPIHTPLAPASF